MTPPHINTQMTRRLANRSRGDLIPLLKLQVGVVADLLPLSRVKVLSPQAETSIKGGRIVYDQTMVILV